MGIELQIMGMDLQTMSAVPAKENWEPAMYLLDPRYDSQYPSSFFKSDTLLSSSSCDALFLCGKEKHCHTQQSYQVTGATRSSYT